MNNLLYEINSAILQLTESFSEGEIDEQTYIDTIENLGADKAIEDVVKNILNLEAEAAALKTEKANLDEKQKRAERTADNLRKMIVKYMDAVDSKKMKAGIFDITKGSSNSVDLLYDDIENYPDKYLVPQKPKLDKRLLLADLKDGEIVDGAIIKTSSHIKIK